MSVGCGRVACLVLGHWLGVMDMGTKSGFGEVTEKAENQPRHELDVLFALYQGAESLRRGPLPGKRRAMVPVDSRECDRAISEAAAVPLKLVHSHSA